MRSLTFELFKTSYKLPDKDSRVIIQFKDTLQFGWFHGKVFETDSEYIYELDEVEYWGYMPQTHERIIKRIR